jgi:hypothetical protein
VRSGRIAIHGVPRSGTTLVGELINSSPAVCYKYQPIFSYALKDFIGPTSPADVIDSFFTALETTTDPFLDQTEARRAGLLPMFRKAKLTHTAYKEVRYHYILPNMLRQCPELRVVLVIRNPLSVISSWLLAPKEFRPELEWNRVEEWRYALKKNLNRPEEYNGFERWKDAARLFLELASRFPEQVYLCEYRRLIADLRGETEKLFSFVGLSMGDQTREFIKRASTETQGHAYSVFRAKKRDDEWRYSLEKEIVEAIKADVANTALQRFVEEEPINQVRRTTLPTDKRNA